MPRAKYRHHARYNGVMIDVSAPTQRELHAKVAEKMEEIDRRSPANLTVAKWADEWLALYKRGKISEKYYRSIQGRINNYVLPSIGDKPLIDVREKDIQNILNGCDGKSKSLVSKLKINMAEMFSKAVSNRYIDRNPCDDVKIPDAEQGTHRSLTKDERALFLAACDASEKYGTWGRLLLYTGIRPQESAGLYVSDIDIDARRLTISRALKADGVIGVPKTKSGIRTIPIPAVILDDMRTLTSGRRAGEYLFARDGGAPLSHQAIKRRWECLYALMQKLATAQNNALLVGDDLTLYCLRHTYCTDMLRAGVPITTAKVFMGHSSTTMVDKIYGHHTPDQTDVAEIMLNALYSI